MSVTQQKKSRRSMILLVAIFVIPVVIAKLALTFHWFNYGVTNNGALVKGELTLNKLGVSEELSSPHWLIMYANFDTCNRNCEDILTNLTNTYVALGREMPRVKKVFLTNISLTSSQQSLLEKPNSADWSVINMPIEAQNNLNESQILIVDPLGNVVLSHSLPEKNEQLPFFGKEILVDLKKLLKYSRIG